MIFVGVKFKTFCSFVGAWHHRQQQLSLDFLFMNGFCSFYDDRADSTHTCLLDCSWKLWFCFSNQHFFCSLSFGFGYSSCFIMMLHLLIGYSKWFFPILISWTQIILYVARWKALFLIVRWWLYAYGGYICHCSEVFDCFKSYKSMSESQHGVKIAKLKFDRVEKYVSKKMDKFCMMMKISISMIHLLLSLIVSSKGWTESCWRKQSQYAFHANMDQELCNKAVMTVVQVSTVVQVEA